jgi:hypothetical protein
MYLLKNLPFVATTTAKKIYQKRKNRFLTNQKVTAQWEIGWKNVKEVILPGFVFTFLIR